MSNLGPKLPKPALGNGRIQRQAKRAFIALDRPFLTTTEAAEWAYPHFVLFDRPLRQRQYQHVRNALRRIADPIARSPTGSGRAWIWRLRPDPE